MNETLLHYIGVAGIFLEVLLIFNAIIIAHEVGHFLAARWRGLEVDKFGLWFGPALFKKTIKGVEYRIGCIPAGGFVSIPQMANPEFVEGEGTGGEGKMAGGCKPSLPEARPLDKIIVAAAGPMASILCGLAFACIVWVVGKPVHQSELTTVIGEVFKGSPAEQAGLLPGDRIVSINGTAITRFSGMAGLKNSAVWNIAKADNPSLLIVVDREGAQLEKTVSSRIPEQTGWGRRPLPQIGIAPAITPIVLELKKNGPAETAGVQKGDVFLKIDGSRVFSYGMIADAIGRGEEMQVTVSRADKEVDLKITPAKEKEGESYIGITWDVDAMVSIDHPNPLSQVGGAVVVMVETLSALFTPGSEIKAQHLSGPVGIMRLYYLLFEMPDGWRLALWFSVVFNVNLAILNLLPIPVLDGGHITLSIIEWIRGRRIGVRTIEFVQTACAVLILGFMLYVTSYDILDYVSDWVHRGK
jgi:regulator of sigma E protease